EYPYVSASVRSRSFHINATRAFEFEFEFEFGRRMRRNSASVRAGWNQWKDCAHTTTSADSSASPVCSAVASRQATRGCGAAASGAGRRAGRSRFRTAFVPVLGEEVEVDVAPRVRADDVLVQRHAESGARRQREEAVHDLGDAGSGALHVRLREVVEVLLD